jgi:hypothetical protein
VERDTARQLWPKLKLVKYHPAAPETGTDKEKEKKNRERKRERE